MSAHERLEAIEARHREATEGRWTAESYEENNHTIYFEDGWPIANDNEGVWFDKADAEFITEAKNHDIPDLVETLKAVLKIDTGNNREVYGNDFEAGMVKALWLVHQTIENRLGKEE